MQLCVGESRMSYIFDNEQEHQDCEVDEKNVITLGDERTNE